MSKPRSLAQKNLSEEDSSGSDAGSEVSLETDRFGFIVTNGSTAGSVGPSPELVRQREAKWINIIGQWDRILLKKSSKVKVQCQKGIPASLRAKCWPLLCGATGRMKQNDKLYQNLDSKPGLQSWVDVIERDLDRQFPFHEMFVSKDGHGQRGLFRVLKAYTQYEPEEGYCQAQGPVAAVLLMNMPAEEAFWCLVQISKQYLPGYYSPLLEGVLFDAAMLTWVLKKTSPAAHRHLQHHGVEPLMFATDWLMCLFTRHLPFNTLLRVWDLFFCHGVRVLLQVAVVLVRRVLGRAEQRKQCPGQMETLERLRGIRGQIQEEEDDAFIAEVCLVPLSDRDLEKQVEKELEKWRKERPSSTFDPRGRCQGHRMVWAKARQNEEEQDREAREKGNLSVPLARSASTLSLSPSMLQKRWRKGGKANMGEKEGGKKVVRHHSMGSKENWRSWTELELRKVQCVYEEEDVVFESHKTHSESNPALQTHSMESKKTDKMESKPTEHPVTMEELHIKEEIIVTEQEENKAPTVEKDLLPVEDTSHCEEREILDTINQSERLDVQSHKYKGQEVEVHNRKEEKHVSGNETNIKNEDVETPSNAGADSNTEVEVQLSVDSLPLPGPGLLATNEAEKQSNQGCETTEDGEDIKMTIHKDELDVCDAQIGDQTLPEKPKTQAEELKKRVETTETSIEDQEIEVLDRKEDKHVVVGSVKDEDGETCSEARVHTNTEVELQVSVDSSHELVTQSDLKLEHRTENKNVQQMQADSVTEETRSETSLDSRPDEDDIASTVKKPSPEAEAQQEREDVIIRAEERKCHSTESFKEPKEKEFHTQTKAETDELAQAQEQSEENAAIQDKLKVDKTQGGSEKEKEIKEEILAPSSSECIPGNKSTYFQADTNIEPAILVTNETEKESNECCKLVEAKEDIILTVHKDELDDCDAQISEQTFPEKPETQAEEATKHVEITEIATEDHTIEAQSIQTSRPDPQTIIQPTSQVTLGPVVEEESREEDVFTPKIVPFDKKPNTQDDKDPPCSEKQSDYVKSSTAQTSGPRSSRSSGELCVRKPSSSRGPRLARRLSEDLFTNPQKASQSQSSSSHTDSETTSGVVNLKQTTSDVTLSTGVAEDIKVQQGPKPEPPKRFDLFSRLRGDRQKNVKTKGKPKMQVPKIVIQDFSDVTETEKQEEKLSSKERRKMRRERERLEKEEEKLRKKKEKELEKERRKPQTRGKSFQVQKEKDRNEKTGVQTLRYSASYAEAYF